MIDRMKVTYQDLDNEEIHMCVYSTTDTTLWAIMAALGEQQNWLESIGIAETLLPHGSALIFELHGTALNNWSLIYTLNQGMT